MPQKTQTNRKRFVIVDSGSNQEVLGSASPQAEVARIAARPHERNVLLAGMRQFRRFSSAACRAHVPEILVVPGRMIHGTIFFLYTIYRLTFCGNSIPDSGRELYVGARQLILVDDVGYGLDFNLVERQFALHPNVDNDQVACESESGFDKIPST